MVTARSFERHASRAGQASEQIRGRRLGEGWATTLLLDREAARAGLRIQSTTGRAIIWKNWSQLETVAPRSVRDYQKISTERVPGPPWSCRFRRWPQPEAARVRWNRMRSYIDS